MGKINAAIVGVGNCAKSLVEGVAFYTKNKDDHTGLMQPTIGGYAAGDINFVAAFDIDERKVGKKLHEAISAEPNRTMKIAEPLNYDVIVQRGPTHDSVLEEAREFFIHESKEPVADVAAILKESGAEILVNYLPTGSDAATYAYAEAALAAGCGFVNCMPTPIAKNAEWKKRFAGKKLVLMGDDIKSQLGATILNRFLLTLFKMRGIRITKSEQVNYGGNADHFNLHYRPHAKEESKEAALNSVLTPQDAKPSARMVYTEENYDKKRAVLKIEGEIFGRIPTSVEVVLEDEDSPNSGGVVIDAVRMAKLLTETRRQADADKACAFLMKAPALQAFDSDAQRVFEDIAKQLSA